MSFYKCDCSIVQAALTALIAFLPTPPNGAIGSLDYSDSERRVLAKRSVRYCCKTCGIPNCELLELEDSTNTEKKAKIREDLSDSKNDMIDVKTRQKERESKSKTKEEEDMPSRETKEDGSSRVTLDRPPSEDKVSILVILLSILIAVLLVRKYGRYQGWIG